MQVDLLKKAYFKKRRVNGGLDEAPRGEERMEGEMTFLASSTKTLKKTRYSTKEDSVSVSTTKKCFREMAIQKRERKREKGRERERETCIRNRDTIPAPKAFRVSSPELFN